MQQLFGHCGKDVWINQPLTLCRGTTISIGDGCYLNYGTTFVDDYTITIGNSVMFGPNVTIYLHHRPSPGSRAPAGRYVQLSGHH